MPSNRSQKEKVPDEGLFKYPSPLENLEKGRERKFHSFLTYPGSIIFILP